MHRASALLLLLASVALASTTGAVAVVSDDRRRRQPHRRHDRLLRGRGLQEDDDDGVDFPRHHGPDTLGDEAGRPAWVVYPDEYDHANSSRLWPLVMMIHGGGSDSYYHDRCVWELALIQSPS